MFSPNQLYDYLRYHYSTDKKNSIIRNFKINGIKDLMYLIPMNNIYTDSLLHKKHTTHGYTEMLDQEPIDIDAFAITSRTSLELTEPNSFRLSFNNADLVFSKSMGIHNPVILHSERNSDAVVDYTDNFFIEGHFWSNAFTSRYWFSHYELLSKKMGERNKRFGVYIRDTNGTRTYRKDLINVLDNNGIKEHTYYPNKETNTIASCASASVEWTDHTQFDIHIVPETIFDTEKIHLTEKIFKPIIMYQSFILLAGPNSLDYIKSYGFKTFGDVWDESYDSEQDTDTRFKKVTDLITTLSAMSVSEFRKLIIKTQEIVDFNRTHFYSEKFKNILLNELHQVMDDTYRQQEESFYTMPGGTLFYYYDLYFKKNSTLLNNAPLIESLQYVYKKSEKIGNAIVQRYNHLL